MSLPEGVDLGRSHGFFHGQMVSAMSFVGAEAKDLHDTTTGVVSIHSLRGLIMLIMIQIDFTNHEILLLAVVAVQFHQNKRSISAWVSWWAVSDWNFLGVLRLNLPTSSNTILSFRDKQMGQYHLRIGFHGTTLNFHKPTSGNLGHLLVYESNLKKKVYHMGSVINVISVIYYQCPIR